MLICVHLRLSAVLSMKPIAPVITSFVVAIWLVAMAILSVQNATPVFLKFLSFQSIQMPVGVVLAISAGIGLIGGAIAQLLWRKSDNPDRLPGSDSRRGKADQVSPDDRQTW